MAILEASCAQNAPGRSTMRPPEALLPWNPTWESSHAVACTSRVSQFFGLENEGGVRGDREGDGLVFFYWNHRRGGGLPEAGGPGSGRVSAGNLVGGGLFFFSGPKFSPREVEDRFSHIFSSGFPLKLGIHKKRQGNPQEKMRKTLSSTFPMDCVFRESRLNFSVSLEIFNLDLQSPELSTTKNQEWPEYGWRTKMDQNGPLQAKTDQF